MAGEDTVETRRALSVTAGLWALLFGPFVVAGGLPVFRDLLVTYLPLRHFWAERVRAGHFPAWFPWEGLGQPFVGQGITASFHPVNLLYLAFNDALALRLEIATAVLVGLLGQVLFARRLKRSAPAATAGALVLGLCGYALSMTSNPAYLRGLCMLPWVALFASRALTAERPFASVAGLAVTWASIPLGGDAAATLFAALVVGAIALGHGLSKRTVWLPLGAVLAGLLAAPELLPSFELRAESIVADFRNADFVARFWALHPERLPELLMPRFTSPEQAWAQAAVHGEPGRWAESVFFGVPVVAFALTAPRQRLPMTFLGLGVLGLWLSLGIHGGLDFALRQLVPALNSVRYPEKHLALAAFGLATAAAFGVERAIATPRALLPWLGGTALMTVVLRFASEATPEANLAFGVALATAAATAGVVWLLPRSRAAAWLAPLLLLVTLWRTPMGLSTLPPEDILTAPTNLPGRVWVERSSSKTPVDEESLRAWALETRDLLSGDLGALDHRAAFGLSANLPLAPRRERSLFGWKLTDTRALAPLYGYEVALLADGTNVALPAAPRAWVATPQGLDSGTELLARLSAAPEAARVHPLVGGALPVPPEGRVGEVRLLRDDVDVLTLEATLEQPGVLVLNDLAADGWSVQVDGRAAQLVVVNALVRGVMLGPGPHQVVFSYELPRGRAGLVLGGVGLLAVLLLLALQRRRAR